MEKQILVVGDTMLDVIWRGVSTRLCPEAPVPVVHLQMQEYQLGGAANVAENIKSLGGNVHLVTQLGKDDEGEKVESLLEERRISRYIIQNKLKPTTSKIRVYSSSHFVTRIDKEQECRLHCSDIDLVYYNISKIIDSVGIIVLSDYGKGFLGNQLCYSLIQLAKKNNIFIIVDPKKYNLGKYKGASLICPNRRELCDLTNTGTDEEGVSIILNGNVPNVLLTKSEEGMSLHNSERRIDFPALCKEPKSLIGAGDAIIAAVSYGLNMGMGLSHSVKFANERVAEAMLKEGTIKLSV